MKTIEIAPSPLWSYIDEMQIEPTYSGTEVAEILGRSRAWVHKHATAQSIGELRNGQRRYTRHDLKKLKKIEENIKMGNPNWIPGKPQSHRQEDE